MLETKYFMAEMRKIMDTGSNTETEEEKVTTLTTTTETKDMVDQSLENLPTPPTQTTMIEITIMEDPSPAPDTKEADQKKEIDIPVRGKVNLNGEIETMKEEAVIEGLVTEAAETLLVGPQDRGDTTAYRIR